MPAWHLGLVLLAVLAGAVVQGVVGLGIGLLVTPVAALIDPALVPGFPLMTALVYPALTLARDLRGVDWRGVAWSLSARVPGTAVGALVVAWASERQIGIVVAAMVLLAVVLSVRAVVVPLRPSTLVAAGFTSGVAGTATSIGGPPMALLYQGREPIVVRGTLGVTFLGGALLSLLLLVPAGEVGATEVALGVVAAPVLVLGFVVSTIVARRVDARRVRVATLVVCTVSALTLLVRSALG